MAILYWVPPERSAHSNELDNERENENAQSKGVSGLQRGVSDVRGNQHRLRAQFRALDPLDLLSRMREAQQHVAQCGESSTAPAETKTPGRVPLADFLASLGTVWQDGEVRPTHHRKARVPRTWRSREDPFEHGWPTIQQWLESEPGITAKKLHERLVAMAPAMYFGAQLHTLQRRVKVWRSNRAMELVTRILGYADTMKAGAATQRQPSSQNDRGATITRE